MQNSFEVDDEFPQFNTQTTLADPFNPTLSKPVQVPEAPSRPLSSQSDRPTTSMLDNPVQNPEFQSQSFLWKRSFQSRPIDPVESAFDTPNTVTSASRLPDSSVPKNEFNSPRPRVQFNEANLSQARNNLG